uniref:Hypothetical conserved protein n=1 Tax=uncultured Planctomycetota bacterium TaxID=120965 RepID=H5SAS6_9BACT|nr:hypothetical conserved protein [uncultured Planctomycetota bacterium]
MDPYQALVQEFDQEMANTRNVLARIPEDKLDWKAHTKSNTLRWVGSHLANIPQWVDLAFHTESLDVAPVGGEPHRNPEAESVAAMLRVFDRNVETARGILRSVKADEFWKPWSLLRGGTVLVTMPRWQVVRTFVINHTIHHRAHLCVYLRLLDVPVPGLYGPSADDPG